MILKNDHTQVAVLILVIQLPPPVHPLPPTQRSPPPLQLTNEKTAQVKVSDIMTRLAEKQKGYCMKKNNCVCLKRF